MALASAPPAFAYYSSNYPSTPAPTPGTGFTAGASGADAAAVSCIAALGHDVHRVVIRVYGVNLNASDSNAAGDLLIDPAGGTSWAPLVSDLACGFTTGASLINPPTTYDFPLWIPAGASIGWQAKTAHTIDITTGFVIVEVYGEPSRPEMWWCGHGVETIGISDSKGTSITPGASGAAGTWTSVGSTTTRHLKAIQLGVNGSDATARAAQFHVEIGAGSQRLPGTGVTFLNISTTEQGHRLNPGLQFCGIPVSTQIQARATSSDATPENIFVAAYGVY